jgi:hypothetical protein
VVVDDLLAGAQFDCGRLSADHLQGEHGHDLRDRLGFGFRCGNLGLGPHDRKQLLFSIHGRQIGAGAFGLERRRPPPPVWEDCTVTAQAQM